MKKIFLMMLVLTMVIGSSVAHATDLEVQVIGGEDAHMETISMDDMQLGATYEIGGYARIMPLSFDYMDVFVQYAKDYAGDNTTSRNHNENALMYEDNSVWGPGYYNYIIEMHSGENADFAWLLVDITNMQRESAMFMEGAEVKVYFNDEYEFQGWVRQFNYNYDTTRQYEGIIGTYIRAAIDPANEEAIDPVYTGHYVFGCTLPNAVVEGTEPLRMEIRLGENDLTYHIRK